MNDSVGRSGVVRVLRRVLSLNKVLPHELFKLSPRHRILVNKLKLPLGLRRQVHIFEYLHELLLVHLVAMIQAPVYLERLLVPVSLPRQSLALVHLVPSLEGGVHADWILVDFAHALHVLRVGLVGLEGEGIRND